MKNKHRKANKPSPSKGAVAEKEKPVTTDTPSTLEALAEPSTEELDKLEAEELKAETEAEVVTSELTDSQKVVAQVDADITKARNRLGEVDEALKTDKGDRIALMGEYIKLDTLVKSLNAKLESAKSDEFRDTLLADIQRLTCNLQPTITRLLYEVETVIAGDGTEVIKPMLRINDEVSVFGKGKKKSGSPGGGGSNAQASWKHRQTGETELASVVYDRDYRGKADNVDGTADAHAWGRVIKALHGKGTALDWEQVEV